MSSPTSTSADHPDHPDHPEHPEHPGHPTRPTLPERARRPLSWRAEVGRQLRRRRTMWSFVLILALPVILVAAFAIGGGGPSGNTIAGLAKVGAANFAIFATAASASFLLVVLTALFVGDAVPSEASWATLRYLLIAPVPRARLLTSKLVVALATAAFAVVLLILWSLFVGGVAYGWASFTNPGGGVLEWSQFGPRLAVIIGYLVVFLLQVGGIAFWLSTRTDAPLAAVGGAVMVTIVSSILSQIETLGGWRNGLPMYYSRSWMDALAPQVDWTGMRHGVLWSLLYTVVLVGLAYRHFQRKDILS
jgi:ABC-2 type transport system permease protein